MRRSAQHTALIATAVAATLTVTGCSAAVPEKASEQKNIAYLWAIGSTDASMVTSDDATYLELTGIEEIITRFSDRPNREASEVDLRDFLGRWEGRLAEDPPNAVLSYQADDSAAPVQVVVEISRPQYDEATSRVVFAAELIEFTPDKLEGADHPVEVSEVALPAHTGPVSLFIDSDGPDVSTGEIQAMESATVSLAADMYEISRILHSSPEGLDPGATADLASQANEIAASNLRIGELGNALVGLNSAINDGTASISNSEQGASLLPARTTGGLTAHGIEIVDLTTIADLEQLMETVKLRVDVETYDLQASIEQLQASAEVAIREAEEAALLNLVAGLIAPSFEGIHLKK